MDHLAGCVIIFWLGFAVAIYVIRQSKPEDRSMIMAMSDCPKCWDTPCTCGWDYKDWTVGGLEAHIAMLQQVLNEAKKRREVEDSTKNALQP